MKSVIDSKFSLLILLHAGVPVMPMGNAYNIIYGDFKN